MAEIVPVVSEALEAKVRNLLPSQRGFGQDLQASNVITPIIDLTASAEGTSVPEYQAQAIAFGSQTAFLIQNATTVIANSPGFYRIFGVVTIRNVNALDQTASFTMTDGSTTKTVWGLYSDQGATGAITQQYDFVVFLATGESISGVASSSEMQFIGSSRQPAGS